MPLVACHTHTSTHIRTRIHLRPSSTMPSLFRLKAIPLGGLRRRLDWLAVMGPTWWAQTSSCRFPNRRNPLLSPFSVPWALSPLTETSINTVNRFSREQNSAEGLEGGVAYLSITNHVCSNFFEVCSSNPPFVNFTACPSKKNLWPKFSNRSEESWKGISGGWGGGGWGSWCGRDSALLGLPGLVQFCSSHLP